MTWHGTATATLAVASQSAKIDVIEATSDGGVLLGGGAGADVVVGRLRPDGHVDPSFGTSGWGRLRFRALRRLMPSSWVAPPEVTGPDGAGGPRDMP